MGENTPKGLVSHDTSCCGLHVHVERAGMSDLTVGKILSFVNSATNKPFVEAVARRSSDRWAKLDPSKNITDATKRNSSRYEAVNLQNEHTIEFRIFKGTLNKESFYRSLEFVDAVVEYCKNIGLSDTHGTDKFFDFVKFNKKHYPELAKFVDVYQEHGKDAAAKMYRSLAKS